MINLISKAAFYILLILAIGCKERTKNVSSKENSVQTLARDKNVAQRIDSLLLEYNKGAKFNGNILIIKENEMLLNKSYGYSDSTKKNLLTADYKFGIGSIYKEFPAVSIMKLKEKGLIDLDDKVGKYIPELPKWSNRVSIKNLLQYTSGLPTINWNKYFSENMAVNDKAILEDLLKTEELEFEPGADYLYTNNSPFLLIKIIEKVTNQTFNEHLKEKFFTPLGMRGTDIKKEYPYKDRRLMALPFDSDFIEDSYKLKSPTLLLTSTVKDLSIWFTKLNGKEVINKESVNFLAQTAELKEKNMQSALGNCELESGEIIEHIHHGAMGNYECLVHRNNKEDWTIVILTNQKNKNVFEISDLIISLINKE